MDENITDAIEFASTDNIADMQTSIQSALQSKIVDALEAKRIEVAQSFMQKANESEEPVDDFEEEDLNEYEIVKRYNPKTGKHEYVDDEGNVMHGSGGASWQKSWYSRKRPSDYSSSTPSSTSQKIYHNVPFKQKDQAKAEGMRFDGEKKKWYHTNGEKSKKSAFPKLQESYLEEKLSVSDGISTWIKDFVHSDDSRFEGKSKEERRQMAMAAFYAAKKGESTNEDVQDNDEGEYYVEKGGETKHTKRSSNLFHKSKEGKIRHIGTVISTKDGSNYVYPANHISHLPQPKFNHHEGSISHLIANDMKYLAKKQQNEEAEELEELSRSGIISRYLNKTKPEYSSPKEIEKRKEGRSLALKKKMGNKKFGFPEPKVKAKD